MATTGNWWDSEVTTVPAPAPTFGFAWADGYVAPFSPADLDAARSALHTAARVAGRPLTDLRFADFGCGDGAVVLLAASLGAPCSTGIDLDDGLLERARGTAEAWPGGWPRGVSFSHADVMEHPLEGTDLLFWHMLPEAIPRAPHLGARLRVAMDGGMVMITVRWRVPLAEWEPYLRAQAGPGEKQLFFVYGSARNSEGEGAPGASGGRSLDPSPSLPAPPLGATATWQAADAQAKAAFQVRGCSVAAGPPGEQRACKALLLLFPGPCRLATLTLQ